MAKLPDAPSLADLRRDIDRIDEGMHRLLMERGEIIDTLIADGGAFLSKGHWYHLAFRCSGTSDRRKIIAFDFATGAQFPDGDPTLPTDADDDD